uniref:Hydrolase_4 domain-containing protein n=1 Tax=Parastrongyloides trichosuri TaxID=131310 RepID=A0A0N4Z4J8_PARTI
MITILLQFLGYITVVAFLFYVIIVPIAARYVPELIDILFYLNITSKLYIFAKQPYASGVRYLTRNFYINHQNTNFGIWHSLPHSLSIEADDTTKLDNRFFEKKLADGNELVVIYCHGASSYRGNRKSIEIMNLMGDMDIHSFIIDYRGYADSSGHVTETNLYEDLITLYNYVKKFAPNRIYIWGHSLGAGIVTKCGSVLCKNNSPPRGVILESAFTNAKDAMMHHPLMSVLKIIPKLLKYSAKSYSMKGHSFRNDENIVSITCPITLLHAEDDMIIPCFMSQKLFDIAQDKGLYARMFIFNKKHGYGHSRIIFSKHIKKILESILM